VIDWPEGPAHGLSQVSGPGSDEGLRGNRIVRVIPELQRARGAFPAEGGYVRAPDDAARQASGVPVDRECDGARAGVPAGPLVRPEEEVERVALWGGHVQPRVL